MNIISYHELRKLSPQKAREVVRKLFEANDQNVSKTDKILGIARAIIRGAVYGCLEDKSRRPKNSPKKLKSEFEDIIVQEVKRIGFRYRRLSMYLQRKYGLVISENTMTKPKDGKKRGTKREQTTGK